MRKVFGLLLVTAGVFLLFYPKIEGYTFQQEQQQIINAFTELGEWEKEGVLLGDGLKEKPERHFVEKVVGILSIEKINLEITVLNEATAENLVQAVGIIEPNKELGIQNVAVAGHRSVTPNKQFNRLGELMQGDLIEWDTGSAVYTFDVIDTFTVHQSEVSILDDQEDPMLTLVTCTPLGSKNPPNRLIVQAKLVKGS